MRILFKLALAGSVLFLSACNNSPAGFLEKSIKDEIIAILHVQDTAWNAGDIDGFMAHYLATENLRFASGGEVKRGWQATIDGYKSRYPDKAAMGTLSFTNLEIKVLSAQYAQVFGRWELARKHDNPGGLFTLLLKRQGGKWVIISDHTSSDASGDPVSIDKESPPTTVELDFDSGGSALNGHLYLADGEGPHPTVIMLHGFPGYEKNLDIAQAARRAGFNVLFFHYRGAWGSAGDFSLTHVIEDALAASAFVRSDEVVAKYRIDRENITFIGHSMGGFAALAAGARDKNVGCVGAMSAVDYTIRDSLFTDAKSRAGFAGYVDGAHLLGKGPLQGTSGEKLLAEMAANTKNFNVSKQAAAFEGRSVLLMAAKDDTVLPPSIYHTALVNAFEAEPSVNLAHDILEGDHSYSWTRLELTNVIVDWLNKECR